MSSIPRSCYIENCNDKHMARDMCAKHYHKWYKYGDPLAMKVMGVTTGHMMSYTSEYKARISMISRCRKPEHPQYKHYGGRGITICERWLESFENFYADMGSKPSPAHSLDRIDNNGNYKPSNCRWATRGTQQGNRRKPSTNTSGYYGPIFDKGANGPRKWLSRIRVEGKYFTIGMFPTAEEAAIAYDTAVIFFRGDDGITNIL